MLIVQCPNCNHTFGFTGGEVAICAKCGTTFIAWMYAKERE